MDLLEKIDELRAQSVNPEKFEMIWGVSIEDHLNEMMAWYRRRLGYEAF